MNSDNQYSQVSGLYTIDVTSADEIVDFNYGIPTQSFFELRKVRVEYDSAANALTDAVISVDLPFLSGTQLVDNLTEQGRLVIPLDNAVVTLYKTEIPLELAKDIPQSYRVRVYDAAGALVTNMVRLTLQFSYGVSRIGQ